jgi:hypothetical protein
LAHIASIQPIIVYAIKVSLGEVYKGICALLVLTSLFEVVYITYRVHSGWNLEAPSCDTT